MANEKPRPETTEQATAIKNKFSVALLAQPGVWSVGVEDDVSGPVIVIRVDPKTVGDLPTHLDGCPVKIINSGPVSKTTSAR